jgi:hypothetical protein
MNKLEEMIVHRKRTRTPEELVALRAKRFVARHKLKKRLAGRLIYDSTTTIHKDSKVRVNGPWSGYQALVRELAEKQKSRYLGHGE